MEIEIDLRKRGAGKVVLVVDDNPAIRKTISNVFLSDGFKTCVQAGNGREAVEAARQINPDIIILDLSMPVMNGLEAASEIRKIFPKVPMILFSLYGDSMLGKEAARAGINLVLMKTESLSFLLNKAHELMGS